MYRAATALPPPPANTTETAVTAALHAGVGDWLAADVAVAAAHSATENHTHAPAATAASAIAKAATAVAADPKAAVAASAAAASAVAADTKAAVASVASEAKAVAATAVRAARQSLTPYGEAAAAAREARESMRMRENPNNLVIKSFADVAVADLELVRRELGVVGVYVERLACVGWQSNTRAAYRFLYLQQCVWCKLDGMWRTGGQQGGLQPHDTDCLADI
jgi:hypothetical protein